MAGIALPIAADPQCERPLSSDDPRIVSPSSLTASPVDAVAYYQLRAEAVSLRSAKLYQQALRAAEELVGLYACDAYVWRLLGELRLQADRPAEAASAFERAMSIGGPGPPGGVGYKLATSYVAAGNKEAALELLEQLVFEHGYLLRPYLDDDAAFAPLRDNPRFLALTGKQNSDHWERTEGWRRDLEHLVAEIRRVSPIYHHQPLPDEFTAAHTALFRGVPDLSDEEIYVGIARLLAMLRQGHTGVAHFFPARRMPFLRLPVQFYAFPEGVYIVAADRQARDLVGGELIAVEDTPAIKALQRVGEVHTRESGMEVLWTGPSLLGHARLLKGLGIAPRSDQVSVAVRLASGTTTRRRLDTVPMGDRPKLAPPPGVEPPLFLKNVQENHWAESISDDTLFVQLNQVQPDPDQTLEAFGKELRARLGQKPIRNVILDLRHNNGGNTYLYPELLRTLIAFSANNRNRLYVIIGRWTYSAASNLATDLARLAQPVFVGEPTSQTGNNFGDSARVILPYSGIGVNVSGVVWQLSDPWDKRPVITPHVPVQLTAAAYFAGRDPALETIQTMIAKRAVSPGEVDPR